MQKQMRIIFVYVLELWNGFWLKVHQKDTKCRKIKKIIQTKRKPQNAQRRHQFSLRFWRLLLLVAGRHHGWYGRKHVKHHSSVSKHHADMVPVKALRWIRDDVPLVCSLQSSSSIWCLSSALWTMRSWQRAGLMYVFDGWSSHFKEAQIVLIVSRVPSKYGWSRNTADIMARQSSWVVKYTRFVVLSEQEKYQMGSVIIPYFCKRRKHCIYTSEACGSGATHLLVYRHANTGKEINFWERRFITSVSGFLDSKLQGWYARSLLTGGDEILARLCTNRQITLHSSTNNFD